MASKTATPHHVNSEELATTAQCLGYAADTCVFARTKQFLGRAADNLIFSTATSFHVKSDELAITTQLSGCAAENLRFAAATIHQLKSDNTQHPRSPPGVHATIEHEPVTISVCLRSI